MNYRDSDDMSADCEEISRKHATLRRKNIEALPLLVSSFVFPFHALA